jgi:hypothetical protein
VKMSPTEAMRMVADQFKNIETTAEKAATAQFLFGRAGAQLVPLLDQGGDALMRFIDEAEKMNLGFSLEEAEKVERYNDAVADLGRAWEGMWRQAAIQAAPHLAEMAERFQNAMTDPQIQVAFDMFAQRSGEAAEGLAWIVENADKLKVLQDINDMLGIGAFATAPGRAIGLISNIIKGTEEATAQVDAAIGKLEDRLDYFKADAIDYFEDTSPPPEWVRRWNEAEDALTGTSDAFKTLLRDKERMLASDKAFEAMLKKEDEKLAKATAEWEQFIERSEARQQAEKKERKPVGFEEGVRAGSAEAIRGARAQWMVGGGDAEKKMEAQQLTAMQQVAANTQAMAQSPVVVRVAGAF